MQRVLVAPDKFKGSLTAAEVADRVATGIRHVAADVEVVRLPVADGGEGTLDAALAAGFGAVGVRVAGPTGEPVEAVVAVRDRTAVVELAAASGLSLLPDGVRTALHATSLGTGQLLRAALDAGADTLVLGVGGSACTDGGAGLLVGLGARLTDLRGVELEPGGGALVDLHRVDLSDLDPRLAGASVVLAGDVDNLLLGPHGAAAVYGPQKGAGPSDVVTLERGLTRWVEVLASELGDRARTAADEPGAGAAGGVGYGVLAALGATRRPGVDVVLDLVGFADKLIDTTLVVTGEGSLDTQTLAGKTPAGVAAAARDAGVPAVAVAGRSLLGEDDLVGTGLLGSYVLTDLEPDEARCMTHAGPLLERLAEQVATDWLLADSDRISRATKGDTDE